MFPYSTAGNNQTKPAEFHAGVTGTYTVPPFSGSSTPPPEKPDKLLCPLVYFSILDTKQLFIYLLFAFNYWRRQEHLIAIGR